MPDQPRYVQYVSADKKHWHDRPVKGISAFCHHLRWTVGDYSSQLPFLTAEAQKFLSLSGLSSLFVSVNRPPKKKRLSCHCWTAALMVTPWHLLPACRPVPHMLIGFCGIWLYIWNVNPLNFNRYTHNCAAWYSGLYLSILDRFLVE